MTILESLRQRWEQRENRLKEEEKRRYEESMRQTLEHQKLPLEKEAAPKREASPLERIAPELAERARQAARGREHAPEKTRGGADPPHHDRTYNPPGTRLQPGTSAGQVSRGTVQPNQAVDTTPTPMETLNTQKAMRPGAKAHERLAGRLDGQSPADAANARVKTASLLEKHRQEQIRQLNREH